MVYTKSGGGISKMTKLTSPFLKTLLRLFYRDRHTIIVGFMRVYNNTV